MEKSVPLGDLVNPAQTPEDHLIWTSDIQLSSRISSDVSGVKFLLCFPVGLFNLYFYNLFNLLRHQWAGGVVHILRYQERSSMRYHCTWL